jgi:hypothetical protein
MVIMKLFFYAVVDHCMEEFTCCWVFQDYGEETEGLNVIQEYVKSH